MTIYEDHEEPRSRLIPILAIVAALLAVAIAVLVVLFFVGVFDRAPTPVAAATERPTDFETTGTEPSPLTPPAAGGTEVSKAIVSVAPPAVGEPPVRSTYGDWQVRCDTPAGARNEQCVLMQYVTADNRENVGLTVVVLKTADNRTPVLRVLAPLGVLLPGGLGLKIDEKDFGNVHFVRCLPTACVAEVIFSDNLRKGMEAGKVATFIVLQTPEEGIGIPISLTGFSDGFANLP